MKPDWIADVVAGLPPLLTAACGRIRVHQSDPGRRGSPLTVPRAEIKRYLRDE